MADRSRCDLPYGQFGRVEYLPHDKSIRVGRHAQLPTVVTALGETKVIDAPHHADSPIGQSDSSESEGKRHARQIKALVEAFPEFEPAASLLPPLLQVSEAAENAHSHHDPLAGSIIAFTNIRSEIRHRALPVVAMGTGTTGCTLQVSQLEIERRGWAEDKTTWLEVPVLGVDQTTWISSGGIIQQLVFAEPTGRKDALLAVRLTSKVVVFRVTIRKGCAKNGTPHGLKLDIIFENPHHAAPERSFMDVSFNPWFSQQIAVIDNAGDWQVFEMSTEKVRQVFEICEGTARDGKETAVVGDGWARISWISDLATVVACTRQRLTVFSIRDIEPSVLREVSVQLPGPVPWILGLMKLPGDMQRFALLTGTHLHLYKVPRAETDILHVSSELRIRHYRDVEDLSLRVTSFTHDDELTLGVYSSTNSTLTMHRLSQSFTTHIASSDPYRLEIPSSDVRAFAGGCVRDLCIKPVRFCRRHDAAAGNNLDQSSHSAQYCTMTVIRSNGIIEGTLYHIQPNVKPLSSKLLTVPSWISKPLLRTTKLSSMDGMVDDSTLENHETQEIRPEPVALRARWRTQSATIQQDYLDFEALADALNQPLTPDLTLEDAVSNIKHVLSQTVPDRQDPAATLDRLLDSELLVREVERGSAEMDDLLFTSSRAVKDSTLSTAAGSRLVDVDLPAFTDLDHGSEVASLSTAYEHIVSSWISTLPSQTAGRIRLAKREIACRIAAELVLASHRLRPIPQLEIRESQTSGNEGHDPVETWDLPVRATRSGLHSLPLSSVIRGPSIQPSSLPTPSPSATPSTTTDSSRISTAAPQLDRLAAYTTLSKPTPLVLPRSLSKVLSHWEVGMDPNEYDWMSKSRHISQAEEDGTQGLTEKERQRAQRQAERHLRRQRKEAAASQASQLASSQAVDIITTSQPDLANTDGQRLGAPKNSQPDSQSQSQVRSAVASQIVRGRHRERPPKKRRKEGF
ncbi:hypothetical protein DOTSEDRAFT_67632 [Dothistroma septosporum NZE10]|uniref:RNA polymerase I-specific transcription initiation factor RRN6-like protein n=1 Tax=Dothistroma septosporum (strain NZE10 / CBS 128990) TaxID=675120 RepID=N1PZ09_DOTSN|nr:hypothetical protein DOTSEDRAFT_67632 [Dothistroma septosporum NZE10]